VAGKIAAQHGDEQMSRAEEDEAKAGPRLEIPAKFTEDE
jgi:hypothetical protein